MSMMQVKVHKSDTLCDWCGRVSETPLSTITIVTIRGAFRDEICDSCRDAFAVTGK